MLNKALGLWHKNLLSRKQHQIKALEDRKSEK